MTSNVNLLDILPMLSKVKTREPDVVVYTYNTSYLGGGDQENHSLRSAQAKKLAKSHLDRQSGREGTHL
jgi:hypothetical protein